VSLKGVDKFLARVPHPQTRKNFHIIMRPETYNLWVIAERILCRHQQQFSINVCARIVGDCLAGPHVLTLRLTGYHYQDFLLHDLPKLLEDVPLAVRAHVVHALVTLVVRLSLGTKTVAGGSTLKRLLSVSAASSELSSFKSKPNFEIYTPRSIRVLILMS
jgi:hypothetical protein